MNTGEIEKELWNLFSNYEYRLFNVYVFNSESDFLCVAKKTGYVWEVEIKVSRSDFKNDFYKTRTNGDNKHKYFESENTFKPNRFCFAVPDGLIKINEVPDYAGLIYIKKYNCRIVKQPKFLHKENLFNNKKFLFNMMNKFYFRNMDLRRELQIREYDLKFGQKRINQYQLF